MAYWQEDSTFADKVARLCCGAESRNSGPYLNPLFEYRSYLNNDENGVNAESVYLRVNTLAPGIKFWSGRYLRWLPTVHVSTGMGENSSLQFQQMILVNELRVWRHRLAVSKYEQTHDGNSIDGDKTPCLDYTDYEFSTDFSLDLETSKLLTPSMPFIGDLALSKYYSGDLLSANGSSNNTVDVGKF